MRGTTSIASKSRVHNTRPLLQTALISTPQHQQKPYLTSIFPAPDSAVITRHVKLPAFLSVDDYGRRQAADEGLGSS
jgi:hypothetical protein